MTSATQTSTPSVIYISHGGGPLPLLGDDAHRELVMNLNTIANSIPRPSAILVVSAHWEQTRTAITRHAKPELIYDYSGFPQASYEIRYPAPGNPHLADKIIKTLQSSNIDAVADNQRGFDHGLFVPLKIMYPDAGIPCLQLSLIKGLNPLEHIQLGKALSGLHEQNLLIIGSGFSFHNMRAFFTPGDDETRAKNEAFDHWLTETCCSTDLDEQHREHRLINWDQAPYARYCHPREEHLLPLHVCYGVARAPARQAFTFHVLWVTASAYIW